MDEIIDRARDWVNVNHPDLEGDEHDAKVRETVSDLADIDATADAAETD